MTDHSLQSPVWEQTLTEKAKTTNEIVYGFNKPKAEFMTKLEKELGFKGIEDKWVLLSDAEAALSELKTANDFLNQENNTLVKEIRQLKEQLKIHEDNLDTSLAALDISTKQVEAAKTIWQKWRNGRRSQFLDSYQAMCLMEKVLGGETPK